MVILLKWIRSYKILIWVIYLLAPRQMTLFKLTILNESQCAYQQNSGNRGSLVVQWVKIQLCHCSGLGHYCGMGLIPGLRTSTLWAQPQKNKKQTNKKKKTQNGDNNIHLPNLAQLLESKNVLQNFKFYRNAHYYLKD